MAAPPDLREASRPAELKLPAAPALLLAEDCERKVSSSQEGEEAGGGGGECRTPTSKESKIPASTSCPPAPRKSRRMMVPRKRWLSDVQLFRVGPELMYRLFRPLDAPSFVYLPPPQGTKKRKLRYADHE